MAIQVCSSLQPKAATRAAFSFLNAKCDKSATKPMKYFDYRPPKLVKGKRWYIEFYYRVPAELRPIEGRDWKRFIVNESINRYKDDNYAQEVLRGVIVALERGYNPFEEAQITLALDGEGESTTGITIKKALEFFLEKYSKRGLEKTTMGKYSYAVELVRSYFADKKLLDQPINKVRKAHIENLLEENKQQRKWGNRQYNNIKKFIYTVFEYLRKKEIIEKNPVEFIESLKSKSKKHKYYDKQLFPKVTAIIKANDPYLWCAVQFVYYLCVRSEKELAAIKVGDIIEDGELFAFRAEATKSGRDELIPIDPNLKEVMKEMGLFKAKKTDYIFSIKGKPDSQPFGKNYFAKKFRVIRKLAGLTEEHTIYSWRHTRAVHLAKAGAKLIDIMKLMRHNDISTTAKYIRSLGLDIDVKDIQNKTQKI